MEDRLGTAYFDLPIVPMKIKVAKATGVAFHTFPVLLLCSRAAGAPGGPLAEPPPSRYLKDFSKVNARGYGAG